MEDETAVTAMRMDVFREVFGLPCPTHIKIDVDTLPVEVDVDTSQLDFVAPVLDLVALVLEDLGFLLVLDQCHADSATYKLIFDRGTVSCEDAPRRMRAPTRSCDEPDLPRNPWEPCDKP